MLNLPPGITEANAKWVKFKKAFHFAFNCFVGSMVQFSRPVLCMWMVWVQILLDLSLVVPNSISTSFPGSLFLPSPEAGDRKGKGRREILGKRLIQLSVRAFYFASWLLPVGWVCSSCVLRLLI